MPSSEVLQSRGRIAALSRSRSANDPELVEERRALAAAKLEQYIQRVVSAAPPLNEAQKARLAAILRGGAAA
jgi:hypothetical protein